LLQTRVWSTMSPFLSLASGMNHNSFAGAQLDDGEA
jgi:hypothetical protein